MVFCKNDFSIKLLYNIPIFGLDLAIFLKDEIVSADRRKPPSGRFLNSTIIHMAVVSLCSYGGEELGQI